MALQQARDQFGQAAQRMVALQIEKEALEETLARLRKTITALSAMCSENPALDQFGITDSVMAVMTDTPFSFTTGEVVNSLEAMGFDLSSQKNAQASVHSVLTRLANKGKLVRVANPKKNQQGHPFEWRGPKWNRGRDVAAGFCDLDEPAQQQNEENEESLTEDDIPF
jgi:hypothetical protein